MPADVAKVFNLYPADVREKFLTVRRLILTEAKATNTGPLTETLKWGEPAYLTEATKAGTTLRLGVSRHAQDCGALFLNCQTALAEDFRAMFGDTIRTEGNRAILFAMAQDLPETVLSYCIRAALTYHRRKST